MIKIDEVKYVDNPLKLNGVTVVNDAICALETLQNGQEVARYEFGDSMKPILLSGEYCVLKPLKNGQEANIGDAVFCSVGGYLMTHLVVMKSNSAKDGKPYYLIGSTDGSVYGWTDQVYALAQGTRIFQKYDFENVEEIIEPNI